MQLCEEQCSCVTVGPIARRQADGEAGMEKGEWRRGDGEGGMEKRGWRGPSQEQCTCVTVGNETDGQADREAGVAGS